MTNDKIYAFIDGVRLELKNDNIRLEAKVDVLQQAVTNLQTKQATTTLKLAFMGFIAASLTGAIVSALALRFIGGLK